MKCNYNIDDIIRLLDNEVDGKKKAELISHLRECSKCRKNYEVLSRTQDFFSDKVNCNIDFNSKVLAKIDLNRYTTNKINVIGHFYLKNYHFLKVAAVFLLTISLSLLIILNLNPIAYTLGNGLERIKEAFVNREDSNVEMKMVVSTYDYIKFQYPKKWELQSETLQDGKHIFKFYIDKDRGIFLSLYREKAPIAFDDKGFKNRQVQIKNGSGVKLLSREKDGYTEFKCIIDNYYAVEGTLKNSLYNKNEALIVKIIQSIELLDSNYNRIPVEKEDTKLSYNTYITKPTDGRTGPGDKFESIAAVPYGKLVRITGSCDTETGRWYLAEGLPNFSPPEILIDQNTLIQQNFWIPEDSIDLKAKDTISFDSVFDPELVAEYTKIIKNNGKDAILLRQLPDDNAYGACLVMPDNLIAVVKKDAEWSMVKRFNANAMESVSDIGWIKNSDYMDYYVSMTNVKPNQGFLAKPFDMFTKPGEAAGIPEQIIKNPITPVNILKYEGDYAYVSSGFNGLAFYVKKSAIRFSITSDDIDFILHSKPDKEKLASAIREDILNWGEIKLHALDNPGTYITLTKEQRVTLAGKLTSITNTFQFDGYLTPLREAVYPFYTLEFVDTKKSDYQKDSSYRPSFARYSLTYTGENKFLVNLGDHQLPNKFVPVKTITVNSEFFDYLKTLIGYKLNTDKNSLNYLMNAEKVKVFYENGASDDGNSPQQVNKCIRTVMDSIDTESANNKAPSDGKNELQMEFYFTDDTMLKIELTDKYVYYNGKYYKYKEALINSGWRPQNIKSSLFAGYF